MPKWSGHADAVKPQTGGLGGIFPDGGKRVAGVEGVGMGVDFYLVHINLPFCWSGWDSPSIP